MNTLQHIFIILIASGLLSFGLKVSENDSGIRQLVKVLLFIMGAIITFFLWPVHLGQGFCFLGLI